MAKLPSDQAVADALAAFRERPKEEQERSVIWQELASFPQWASAQYIEAGLPAKEVAKATAPVTKLPPDPRLPGHERAALEPQTQVQPQKDGSTTIKTSQPRANPWADYKEPAEGACLLSVQTDVRPPFRGEWKRVAQGWFRAG